MTCDRYVPGIGGWCLLPAGHDGGCSPSAGASGPKRDEVGRIAAWPYRSF